MALAKALRFSFGSDHSTAFPIGFVARQLVLYLIFVKGLDELPPPFLSFIPGLDFFREVLLYHHILNLVYWGALFSILLNFRLQNSALILSSVLFLEILSNRLQFSNSLLFCACFLFLIGMFRPGSEWIYKVQISLLYLGAGINKILEEDWRSGQYFDYFFSEAFENRQYIELSSYFSENNLAILLSYSTILIELTLGVLVLILSRNFWMFFSIHLFHLMMLILTAGALSIHFYSLMSFCSLLILPWNTTQIKIGYYRKSKFFNFLNFLDFNRFFIWKKSNHEIFGLTENDINIPPIFGYFKVLFNHKMVFVSFVWMVTLACIYKNQLLTLFKYHG